MDWRDGPKTDLPFLAKAFKEQETALLTSEGVAGMADQQSQEAKTQNNESSCQK